MNFFTGVVTGLGALVAPLLLASLFLPGPDGANLSIDDFRIERSAPQAEAPSVEDTPEAQPQPEIAAVDDTPAPTSAQRQWTRHTFDTQGFSVERPADWVVLTVDEMKDMGAGAAFGGSGAADAMMLAISNSRIQGEQKGTILFFDLGRISVQPLAFLQGIEAQLSEQMPLLRVKRKSRRVRFAGFDGAAADFETASAARLLMPNVDQRFSAIKLNGRMIFMTSTIDPDADLDDVVARMERSLRLN